MFYTFEFTFTPSEHFESRNWTRSKREFKTLEEAASAATNWLTVCFENDAPAEVRLVKVGE